MDQQRRTLTGMTNGLPTVVPISPAAAAVLHTFDAAPAAGDGNGRPYLDQLSLWVQNSDVAAQIIIVAFNAPGAPQVQVAVSVSPREIVQVYNETVFGGAASGLGGATLTVQTSAGVCTAWGWYVRTQG